MLFSGKMMMRRVQFVCRLGGKDGMAKEMEIFSYLCWSDIYYDGKVALA
jgi:hypothetical protein